MERQEWSVESLEWRVESGEWRVESREGNDFLSDAYILSVRLRVSNGSLIFCHGSVS